MAFVSAADLGLNPGQRYFGISLFADDVNEQEHDLLDPSTFPNDTSDDDIVVGDDADIYGGVAGYYFADELSVISGRLFLDVNLNGISDPDEAAISDVTVSLFSDVNGNGMIDTGTDVQLGESTNSNINGNFQFPGVVDGNVIVVLDESDPQIPDGLVVAAGTNPQSVPVAGGTSDPVSFSFVSESGTGSGSGSDGGVMGDGTDGGTGGATDGGTGDATDGGTGDGTDGGTGDGTDGGTGDGTDGGTGDGTDGGTGDDTDGGTGDGTDGGTGGGTDGDTGDGTDGGIGDGTDGGTGDGTDGGTGDGTDGGTGDGTDGGTGDGSDGGTDGGTGGGLGDGADGGTDDGTDGGTGDGTDGGTGDGTDGGTGDGTDSGTGDGLNDGSGNNPDDGTPIADDATAANSDEFTVNQGDSIEVDVLLNDIDGAGAGLTLVSFTESPNATITITDDDKILYVPNAGYFSPEGEPDTFMYTLEDADGTERTGNVVANVVRFSDLNGNGQNDFVECNCTDLFLETGVDGSGIGHTSRFALFALGLLLLGRLLYSPLSMSVKRRAFAKKGV